MSIKHLVINSNSNTKKVKLKHFHFTYFFLIIIVLLGTTLISLNVHTVLASGDDYPSPDRNATDCSQPPPNGFGISSWCINGNDLSSRGFGYRNCTDYVAWELGLTWSKFKFPVGKGDARDWANYASNAGYSVTQTPSVGDIAWWGTKDHVAVVTAVNPGNPTTVDIDEYNVGSIQNSIWVPDGNFSHRTNMTADAYLHKGTSATITPSPPPAVPVITGTGGDQTNDVTITWSESGGTSSISSFNVYRNGQKIGSVPGTQLSYDDTSIPDGGELSYQVQAINSGGSSALSTKVTVPYLSPGQSGVAWVSTQGHIDYCRRVGVSNNQSSHISCTPFSNSSFGATVESNVLDWGFNVGRAWVNVGNNLDYCRRTGVTNNQSSYLECTPFNGTSFGSTVTSPLVDWGYDVAAAWVPIGTGVDYCRRTGVTNNQSSYLECTPFNGITFGSTVKSPLVDWGYDMAADWVSTGTGVEYCRRAGLVNNQSSYLECTPFNGTTFGSTVTSPLVDWGYNMAADWVSTGTGVEYCRRTGLVNNKSSYIECTPFNGTNFASTVTSKLLDWGYDN